MFVEGDLLCVIGQSTSGQTYARIGCIKEVAGRHEARKSCSHIHIVVLHQLCQATGQPILVWYLGFSFA